MSYRGLLVCSIELDRILETGPSPHGNQPNKSKGKDLHHLDIGKRGEIWWIGEIKEQHPGNNLDTRPKGKDRMDHINPMSLMTIMTTSHSPKNYEVSPYIPTSCFPN